MFTSNLPSIPFQRTPPPTHTLPPSSSSPPPHPPPLHIFLSLPGEEAAEGRREGLRLKVVSGCWSKRCVWVRACVCVCGEREGVSEERREERMSEGWRGVALVTGSGALVSPAGANRDNEGVLGGRRGGRDGAQTRPLPLPASFAPVLPVCSSSSFALDLVSFPLFLPPSLPLCPSHAPLISYSSLPPPPPFPPTPP